MTDQAPQNKPAGKGKATPSRKVAQAATLRPLITDNSKEGKAAAKAKAAEQRARIRAGQAAGDERYLPLRERGPQKRFVRDLIDSRYSVGEFLVPVMVVFAILSFLDTAHPTSKFNTILNSAILLVFFLIAIDTFAIFLRVKRALAEKFDGDLEKNLVLYAVLRSTQLRVLRLPKPQVKPSLLKKD